MRRRVAESTTSDGMAGHRAFRGSAFSINDSSRAPCRARTGWRGVSRGRRSSWASRMVVSRLASEEGWSAKVKPSGMAMRPSRTSGTSEEATKEEKEVEDDDDDLESRWLAGLQRGGARVQFDRGPAGSMVTPDLARAILRRCLSFWLFCARARTLSLSLPLSLSLSLSRW